ncbi:MAG TPA: hypothetical protein VF590_20240, partial [Isosphaeraceae bacterium]
MAPPPDDPRATLEPVPDPAVADPAAPPGDPFATAVGDVPWPREDLADSHPGVPPANPHAASSFGETLVVDWGLAK